MSSHAPSRAASSAERRTSASVRQRSRPQSAIDQENRPDGRPQAIRKTTTTTTETRTELRTRDERLVRRTRSPLKTGEMRSASSFQNRAPPTERPQPKPRRDESISMWTPLATLLPPSSSAPLANRISIPPMNLHAPTSLQPPALSTLTLEGQEKAITEDLLFALMGFEGRYIHFNESYDPLDELNRLTGPTFKIANGLDPSLRDMADRMLRTATHYSAIEVFVDTMGKEESGTVIHALCAAIRKLLKDYFILIAQLEHQSITNSDFTLHQLNLHLRPTSHIISQLYNLAQEVLKENSMLGNVEEDVDQSDDIENILESLREGRDAGIPGKKTCKGGSVLRLITERLLSSSGDPTASQLLNNLLNESSRPYMRMLNEWLHHGNVRDPHGEFLIKEQKSIRREGLQQDYTDEYWEKRYTLRPDLVPPQLEAVKDRVLLAGKYLNVVRECGGISNVNTDLEKGDNVPHTFSDPRFLENVSKAYAFANRSLMALLLTTHALSSRLRSLKHYFFLDRSDFFSYFLDLSSSELRKPAKNVNTGKLQSLLDIVLRQPGSVAAEDPFKEDVSVTMSDTGLTGWLMRVVNVQGMDADASSLSTAYTPAAGSVSGKDDKDINGYEAMTLDYAVPFPLSLIISRNTLTRYQLLFRYILSLRHLEMSLTQSWTEHNKTRAWTHRVSRDAKLSPEAAAHAARIENWKRRAWTLRSRMLCFVQQLLYFCTSEVIEPNWGAFMTRLAQAEDSSEGGSSPQDALSNTAVESSITVAVAPSSSEKRTVDELMQDHVDFLATCLKECMLTNSKLLRINSKVMSTCSLFANYTSSLTRYLASADPDLSTSTTGSRQAPAYDPAKLDKLFSILQQYEDHFSRHLKILLDALNYLAATETVVFLGLCARLSMANEGGPTGGPGIGAFN
ncbi:Hypothetical protein R9X50_00720900 [Acrodontium crateriforme]|uniref:Spindle pole body component n=1 Tax=Acrodontium crateriforme TaxID=150365 RepID=A0AAQ3RCM5_9PEZI|nr:Hypothetical protein R9X50_00720900 [Acrodontium crateriforme]